jgi:2'-5' RNA ligase
VSISGAGAFPSAAKARVLWAGIQGDRRALGALAASVAAGARRAGAAPPAERASYHPHLTLARTRDLSSAVPLVDALAGFVGSDWTADTIHLIQSLLRQNPRYRVIGSWPLVPTRQIGSRKAHRTDNCENGDGDTRGP